MNSTDDEVKQVWAFLQDAVKLSESYKKTLRFEHSGARREAASMVLFSAALQHASSIELLISGNRVSSATALLRVAIETLSRAIWLLYSASECEVNTFLDEDRLPSRVYHFSDLVEAADECFFQSEGGAIDGCDGNWSILSNLISDGKWKIFNSFTHGGFSQILASMSLRDESLLLDPPLDDSVMLGLIETVGTVLLVSTIEMLKFANIGEDERTSLGSELLAKCDRIHFRNEDK